MTHTMMATSEQTYSKEEQQKMIEAMRKVNALFYPMAQQTGCHAFIEFCGLQAKFIDLCQVSMEQGIEFPMANAHTGVSLAIDGHHVEYLAEKFECLYGPAFIHNPELAELFVNRVFGRELEKHDGSERRGPSTVGAYLGDLLGAGRRERVRSEVLRSRARLEGAASEVRQLWGQRDARVGELRDRAADRARALKAKALDAFGRFDAAIAKGTNAAADKLDKMADRHGDGRLPTEPGTAPGPN